MKYFTQTNNTTNTDKVDSTAGALDSEFRSPSGVVFRHIESDFREKNSYKSPIDNVEREELTQEEEDRFYKKAFKTSLI